METIRNNFKIFFLTLLLAINATVWIVAEASDRGEMLSVVFLNVGQGDAIFIEAPNGNQILIDGGSNKKVLSGLSRFIPFYDHSIDAMLATHPDKDHIAGLSHVVKNYRVSQYYETGKISKSSFYTELENEIEKRGIEKNIVQRGVVIVLDRGRNIYLRVLSPNEGTFGEDTNSSSIVVKLFYGDRSFLLMGDVPKKVEKKLVSQYGKDLQSDILKLGHHGSRTSSDEYFVSVVSPAYAIISAGLNNSYGHPHKEVLDVLSKFKVPHFETFKDGDIVVKTDGKELKYEFR